MELKKLSPNAKKLLDEIVQAENPTQLVSDRFDGISGREDEELRGLIRELCQAGYISIPMWADNKPYNIIVNDSARSYNEQLMEFEAKKGLASYTVINQSVNIGNGNKINNSNIASKIEHTSNSGKNEAKKSFYEKHPVICGLLISVAAGFILLFSFWPKIVEYIERVI